MNNQDIQQQEYSVSNGALLVGAGLAVVSFIVLPAVASRLGVGSSLTGALRMVLMKASTKLCTEVPASKERQVSDA